MRPWPPGVFAALVLGYLLITGLIEKIAEPYGGHLAEESRSDHPETTSIPVVALQKVTRA